MGDCLKAKYFSMIEDVMGNSERVKGDHLVRATGLDGRIRALAVRSSHISQTLEQLHHALPTATSALTRLATAALLMGGTITGREQVSLQVRGSGALGEVLAIADAHGHVRATIDHPDVDLPRKADGNFDLGSALGAGFLTVTKSLQMREPYRGIVPLVSGEIAQDLAHYFVTSEQNPSAVVLGEYLDADQGHVAGGLLLQPFPGAEIEDNVLKSLDNALLAMPPVSTMLREGVTPEGILRRALPDLNVLETTPVSFQCTCSRERYERILITLGRGELEAILHEQGQADLNCHFCNRVYHFSTGALERLLEEAQPAN